MTKGGKSFQLAIGTPGTPGVGVVILATVLNSAGVPASGIALIIGVDRILDMARTSTYFSIINFQLEGSLHFIPLRYG